jgi:two-component system LytT family response regulator
LGTINIVIVDDEQQVIDTLTKVFTGFFTQVNVVGSATNTADAYQLIKETKPQLVCLDVEMGTENGFQLLEKFDDIDFHVAFITAHEEFALKAIKFSAIDYIIKPASISELKTLLQKVDSNGQKKSENLKVKHMFGNMFSADKNEHKLTVSVSEGIEFIKVCDIYYLSADGSYTHFYLRNGTKITTSKNLKFFEGVLEDYGFFRIHNSTLINLKHIRKLNKSDGGYVIMENNEALSISKSRKEEFFNLLSL